MAAPTSDTNYATSTPVTAYGAMSGAQPATSSTTSTGQYAPLASLQTALSKYTTQTYSYPLNIGQGLSDTAQYPHVVKFYVNVPVSQQSLISSSATPGQTQTASSTASGTAFMSGGVSTVSSATTLLQPSTGQASAAYAQQQTRIASTVALYMPDTVSMSYDVGYEDTSLIDKTLFKVGQHAEDVAATIFGTGRSTTTFAQNILAAFQSTDKYPVEAKLQSEGISINPNVQLLFKAVGLRQFQFEFMFSPKSSDEADQVQGIVQLFKFHSAPEVAGSFDPIAEQTSGASNGLAFIIPSTFNIQFLYYNSDSGQWYENQNIHKIGQCVCESVTVDYAPNGWSTFKDGKPTQTRLTLQFKETNIITKSDVSLGY
jgi:uncharacterized protein